MKAKDDGPGGVKVYVGVRAEFRTDGVMLPREIIWEDGSIFPIDRVRRIDRAAARRAGGQGDRYTVMIRGQETCLFFEHSTDPDDSRPGRWFVERRAPQQGHEAGRVAK